MPDTPSHTPIPPELEHELRAMTTWTGEKPELWQAALNSTAVAAPRRRWLRIGLTTAAAAALILLAVGILMPALGNARKSVGTIAFEGGFASPYERSKVSHLTRERDDFIAERKLDGSMDRGRVPADESSKAGRRISGLTEGDVIDGRPDVDSAARQVIRKATIELIAADTREAFAKCQHLLRADLSEFIEGSSLTGQGKDARAQLTLRVAATGGRLDEVLNTLRTLGKVESENATGDDVTAQAVDLDASLRNERQVESEILRLLDSRKDAKLSDIIELRDKLAQIRLGIERLQGRRDTLARQVSLASILVIIRAEDAAKEQPKPASLTDSFTKEVSAAWDSGLAALTATIAFIIRIAIGGLVWWLLIILAFTIARRLIRRLIPDPTAIPRGA